MSEITILGKVEKVYSQNSRFGDFFKIIVDGQHYTYGDNPPATEEGDTVTFVGFEKNKFWNIKKNTLRVTSQGQPAPANAPTAAPPSGNTNTVVSGPTDRELNINFQSARKDAIALLQVAVAAGIDLPIAKAGKGKSAGDAYNSLPLVVEQLTDALFLQALDTERLKALLASEKEAQEQQLNEASGFSE